MSQDVLLHLNDAQRRVATTLDEPIFVSAGAGSGKTSTLTQRIVWALTPGSGADGGPFIESLDEVLVITFTNAAAREIKERVRATLRAEGMEHEASCVDDAWISTIHSMCSRILHRHALDLGIDPSFEIAEGSVADKLVYRAMNDVIDGARGEPAFVELIEEFGIGTYSPERGYTGAMGLVKSAMDKASTLPDGQDSLVACESSGIEGVMRDCLAAMEDLGACKLTAKGAEAVLPSLRALRAFALLPPGKRTPKAAAEALSKVKLPSSSASIREILPHARVAFELASAEVHFCRTAHLADVVLDLAKRLRHRYAELKDHECLLDNDDLVRLALIAVRDHEEVRRDYAGRFRLVMVDEFQDTDETQLALINLLAGESALCTVGDAQQSIYRFRGADLGVFERHGRSIGERFHVRIDVNYRSHPDVLALVERICSSNNGDTPGMLKSFMHLEADRLRSDCYRARSLPRIDLEVVTGSISDGARSKERSAALAASVADAFLRLREAGEHEGDMALLLGRTTYAELYIDAIRSRGMECVVTGGSTFTNTNEVKVMQALLHTLANPADTKSGTFPVLASEMFGLDANDLCELGTREQDKICAPTKRTIDKGLADLALYGGHVPSARLLRAHEVLMRALDDVSWRPVADVCADVVRDSGWLARLETGGTSGKARAANVLAAIRYIRDLTHDLGLGPARAAKEFDRWLATTKVAPATLQGVQKGSEGTISVMTIHASKGLEFPICAVSECWSNPQTGSSLVFDKDRDGVCHAVLRPKDCSLGKLRDLARAGSLDLGVELGPQAPLVLRFLAAERAESAAEAQEDARVLYVALTRAREALVVGIDAASTRLGVSSNLARATCEALGVDVGLTGVGSVDYGGSEPARLCLTHIAATADSADDVATSFEDEALRSVPFELFEVEEPIETILKSFPARAGVFSYSSVHAKLVEKDNEGSSRPVLPHNLEAVEAGAPTTDDVDRATNLGSAFHELAQAMVECGGPVGEDRILAQVRQWGLSQKAEARLRAALDRWEHSSIRAEALSFDLVRAEAPFFQKVDSPYGDYLEGAIDLLCCDEAGKRALVVDYKTGDVHLSPNEIQESHAMQARFYAGVLLAEGFSSVDCAFVCVERDDPDCPREPLIARYSFC